jgi:hypothetical protein
MNMSNLYAPVFGIALAFSSNLVLAGGASVSGNIEGQGSNDVGTESFVEPAQTSVTTEDGAQITVSSSTDASGAITTTATTSSADGTTIETSVTIQVDGVVTLTTSVNGEAATTLSLDLNAPDTVIVSDTGGGISQETADGLLSLVASAPESVRNALREIINRSVSSEN